MWTAGAGKKLTGHLAECPAESGRAGSQELVSLPLSPAALPWNWTHGQAFLSISAWSTRVSTFPAEQPWLTTGQEHSSPNRIDT